MKERCEWCGDDPLYIEYHDKEWGVPVHDDRLLFEFLILEGAQAGLSWITILKKRDNYREAFDNFDFQKIALYSEEDIRRLLNNPGIVRNRLKINSAVKNARAVIKIIDEFGSLDTYLWGFVNKKSIQNRWQSHDDIPVNTDISDKMSRDMKKRGMSFTGSTICYSFMQATGMVNDHIAGCFRHREIMDMS